MAEVALNFAVKMLRSALDERRFLRQAHDDMEWLLEELKMMRRFLVDAERRSSLGDEVVKNWVREITDAAYEAEDIAGKFAHTTHGSGFRATLRRYSFRLKELRDIGNDIKRLKEKIVQIGKRRERYGMSSIGSDTEGSSENLIHELRRRPLFQDEEDVIGLEYDKNKVMELLHAEERRRYVIGIVGMGGMGKTTLARQVFKSINKGDFPMVAWLDLSQKYIQNHQYPIHKLLIEIAKQVMSYSSKSESLRIEELSELVKTKLTDQRYLIVMDDMWETDVWDLIKEHLPDKKNGSRIIITTRNENVAKHPSLHFPLHLMEGLDDRQSWDLFTRLVFEDEERIRRECVGQLRELAEELVRGCGGSPLALTILGGLLAGKETTHSAWQDVLGNRKWLRGDAGRNCLDILKLSYRDLPQHLKWCFLYLGAFPEDHEINVEKLIRLWVAEGFVMKTNSCNESIVEDIARTYIDDLRQRCLIRVCDATKVDLWTGDCFVYCRIHDAVRELSINEAKEANFMNFEIEVGSNQVMHRISLQDKFSSTTVHNLDKISLTLRTLLNFTRTKPIAFKNLYLLRVLDLEGSQMEELPTEVGDMILLRYLSIKDTACKSLPHSIRRLSYLETLDCRASYLFEIPDTVWKIKTLKNVYGRSLFCQVDISHLIYLQTLVRVVATRVILHSLQHLTHLRVLFMYTDHRSSNLLLGMDIWKALQILPSLKVLKLSRFHMTGTIINKTGFPSLQRLAMSECVVSSWELENGSMPSLEFILMSSCKGLKRLPRGLTHCKKLRNFYFLDMDEEFMEWYENGKNDNSWDFHRVIFTKVFGEIP